MENRYELFSSSISSIYHDMQKIERVEMAPYQLKGPHVQCLLAMSRYPHGLTAAKLCEVCDKDKAAISRILSELESAAMITRDQKNGNRYRALLRLTQQGHAAAQTVVEKVRLAMELAGTGFDSAEREIFYRVLTKISGNLHTLCKEGLKRPTDSE